MKILLYTVAVLAFVTGTVHAAPKLFPAPPAEPVSPQFTKAQLHEKWRARINSFLDRGVIPIIDMQSSIKRKDAKKHLAKAAKAMDELGVALIAFDAYQAPKKRNKQKGYRWSYDSIHIANAYPDRFIAATNGGTNNNWLKQKESFIDQLESQGGQGGYALIGELDFRHYMSNSQCKKGKTERDTYIPLTSENGRRVFALAGETGLPVVIHLEPEDGPLAELETALKEYPKAKVVVAHFGQIRFPEKQKRFGPELALRLLSAYPNLYYDLSVGHPGRRYKCNDGILDTVIWQESGSGKQTDKLKTEYAEILTRFSGRFVAGFDYGGGRGSLPGHLKKKVKNIRLILNDLPETAQHNIAYRNAWRLLTQSEWGE